MLDALLATAAFWAPTALAVALTFTASGWGKLLAALWLGILLPLLVYLLALEPEPLLPAARVVLASGFGTVLGFACGLRVSAPARRARAPS